MTYKQGDVVSVKAIGEAAFATYLNDEGYAGGVWPSTVRNFTSDNRRLLRDNGTHATEYTIVEVVPSCVLDAIYRIDIGGADSLIITPAHIDGCMSKNQLKLEVDV